MASVSAVMNKAKTKTYILNIRALYTPFESSTILLGPSSSVQDEEIVVAYGRSGPA